VGEPARRALGRPLLNLVPPACRGDFAPLLDARMGAARRKGRFRVQGEDGTVRHFDVSVVPWYADTQIAGYSGSAVDVTERVEIEERLSAQRDFSALLLEISPLPISLVDEQDRYITVNQAWEAFRGLRREEDRMQHGQPARPGPAAAARGAAPEDAAHGPAHPLRGPHPGCAGGRARRDHHPRPGARQ
jgi:PAS domain-containing protein